MHLQISPSQLETFRKYYEGTFDGLVTAEKLIESIKRRTEYEPEMGTGEAYHKVIEFGHEKFHKPEIAVNHYEVPVTIFTEGQKVDVVETFLYSELVPAIKYREKYKGLIFEIPNTLELESNKHDVLIKMRLDAMYGNHIHENKTVYSNWKMEQFEDSLPWQIYLTSTDSPRITFNVFELLDKREQDIQRRTSCFSFDLYADNSQKFIIKEYVALYIDFLENNNLLNYAQRR